MIHGWKPSLSPSEVVSQRQNLNMPGQRMTNSLTERLHALAEEMRLWASRGEVPEIQEPLDRLETEATTIAEAWSGSSLGFHSRVYYADLRPPPPGAHFSSEWGFLSSFQGTTAIGVSILAIK
jgi:hypothetical protein